MPSFTPNYNFKKPAQTGTYNVDDFNGNSDIIDTELKKIADTKLGKTEQATDSKNLGGHAPSYFSPSTHNHSGVYLGVDATAKNSEKVGNVLADNVINGKFLANQTITDANTTQNKGVNFNFGTNNVTNFPQTWSVINTYKSDDSSEVQTCMPIGGLPQLYIRNKSNNMYRDWAKVWCDGNDGANSGLDADLLDGQHGDYYAKQTDMNNKLDKTEKASDSNNLDGHDSTYFAKQTDMSTAKTDIEALKIKPTYKEVSATLVVGAWTQSGQYFYQYVNNNNFKAVYNAQVKCSADISSYNYSPIKKEYNKIETSTIRDNQMVFYCLKKPTLDIPLNITITY